MNPVAQLDAYTYSVAYINLCNIEHVHTPCELLSN